MKKILTVAAVSAALLVPASAHAAIAPPDTTTVIWASPSATGTNRFDTVADLMAASGLSGTVETAGHASADDGAGMTYSVVSALPAATAGDIAVPLADGRWAVPAALQGHPRTRVDDSSVEDAIRRARTFADAGKDIVWDPTRPTPLSGRVIHNTSTKPYALTCSSFVGMVLQGWDYSHTTYVADQNTRVGGWVDFGQHTNGNDLWQAHKLARWFYVNGDMWLDAGAGDYRRGDILFFSKQHPEGENTTGTYFGNVYHVAIYLGDGQIIHSYGPASEGGVVADELSDYLRADLSFVARPSWQDADRNPDTGATTQSTSKPTFSPTGTTTGQATTAQTPTTQTTNRTPDPATTTQPSGDHTVRPAEDSAHQVAGDPPHQTMTTQDSTTAHSPMPPGTRPSTLPKTGAGSPWR